MQALHSEHWYAVRQLCPRLREGVEVVHRRLRGQPWVLLIDPASHRFHRVSPKLWELLVLMDGKRSLDQIWQRSLQQAEERAAQGALPLPLGQPELVELLAQLHGQDLLQTQVTPDAGEVFERYTRQRRQRLKQALFNPMGLKLPLFYPDRWFQRQAAGARWLFSPWAVLLWLVVVLPALPLVWQHGAALSENLADRVLSASNLALLWVVYPLVKSLHEWAHGLAVRHWGGTVREMGLMFVVFTPVPYVDASASHRFPSKWARAAVAGAGIAAELLLGAVALYVWLAAESGQVRAVAYNVVLITGFSTLVVNGNPLMRYDGYYMLCDLIELPNLAQRSTHYLTWLFDRWFCGATDAEPPLGSEHERVWLLSYGLIAPLYRWVVMLGLAWFVAGEYFFVGVGLALLVAWSSLIKPLWQGWQHLRKSPTLGRRRAQALRRSAAAVALLVGAACSVPVPFYSVHEAVVWPPDEALVRNQEAGHVARVLVAPGAEVRVGQVLAQLSRPELEAQFQVAQAEVAQLEARLRSAEVNDRIQLQALRAELTGEQSKRDELGRKVAALAVQAQATGRWVPADGLALEGRYLRRGTTLGHVVAGPSALLRVAVTQDDMALVRAELAGIQVRLLRYPDEVRQAQVQREVPGGARQLVSAALGSTGGGAIPTDPADREGRAALQRVFDLELRMDRPVEPAVFGDRALVRFELAAAPLARQWFLRLRQAFLARLSV
ncbi:MAG TPA: biotin/lipoyl-binding protein [Burkholderiaceae bacterium]|nr:biotin/lipoyl-binding protein [Burkholderiaceae bacterium]HNB42834.1 biotin/lipoyl-binding protein [Burkholderiaceae bacterium]HNG78732.1 biotin/lipoyl-binding protein [Burkholderiaceae bacterium]